MAILHHTDQKGPNILKGSVIISECFLWICFVKIYSQLILVLKTPLLRSRYCTASALRDNLETFSFIRRENQFKKILSPFYEIKLAHRCQSTHLTHTTSSCFFPASLLTRIFNPVTPLCHAGIWQFLF